MRSMEKSKCLITDNSGIAIEYMIALKKPVLYLDELDKVHNSEFEDYAKLKTIDQTIKEKFGYLFDNSDFQQIEVIIKNSEDNFNKKIPDLEILIDKNYFNFGKTKDFYPQIYQVLFKYYFLKYKIFFKKWTSIIFTTFYYTIINIDTSNFIFKSVKKCSFNF